MTSKEKEYADFLLDIKERIRKSQYEALKAVNRELIALYWDLGQKIVQTQEKHGWGKSVVETLSIDLQKEYPGIRGFSSQNLWAMRQFHVLYRGKPKLLTLLGEISWSKNLIIMNRCQDDLEREFYIKMTRKFGWTHNVLAHHLAGKAFERTMLGQTNFDKALPTQYASQAALAVKDEYTFDFLGLGGEHLEKEMEGAVLLRIRRFLSELGEQFCFVGSQYRLEVDDEEYFIDLLLYHRKLRSLVALELKTGKFKPEYAGKMQFYLSALDDKVRVEGENPSIGIIICREKSRTVVEYALRDARKPIGVATYRITSSLPLEMAKFLPSKEDIEKHLKHL